MTKTNGTSLKTPQFKTPTVNYEVTKRLSPPSLVLIGFLYSLALIKVTIFFNKPKNIQQGYLTSKDLRRILDEKLEKELNNDFTLPVDYLSRSEFTTLKRDLMNEFKKLRNKQDKIIGDKQILQVKRTLHEIPTLKTETIKKDHGKVLIYNIKNKNLLWTQYNQKRNRLKDKIEKQKNKLLYELNLNDEVDVEKFKDFQDISELKLKELQEEYHMKLNKFKEQQYLIVEN